MESEIIKIRSSIDPQFKRKILLKGTFLASCGALLWLAACFMPPALLKHWGLPIFLLGSGLIALGLIPYRRLTQLEVIPNELVLDKNALHYFQKKRLVFSIPINDMQQMFYVEQRGKYGLAVKLKDYDFFFPYFSKSSCKTFQQEFEEVIEVLD